MNNIKKLVILIGKPNGGEKTWRSIYKFLLDENSDLALCFGNGYKKNISLVKKAKYIWDVEEYQDWEVYFNQYYSQNVIDYLKRGKEKFLAGGINNLPGTGAIVIAFRDIIYQNYIDILKKYDQVIISRSDYFYVSNHNDLDNKYFWIVEGEDYQGITDRHQVFPGYLADKVLGICKYLDKKESQDEMPEEINTETVLLKYYQSENLDNLIKRFKRIQFLVSSPDDMYRWPHYKSYKLYFFSKLIVKYPSEFNQIFSKLNLFQSMTSLNNLILKINYILYKKNILIPKSRNLNEKN